MKVFTDRVAVVTGAASGIGRGIALRCALEGMKVVLADVEQPALAACETEVRALGGQVMSVLTDVSQLAAVQNLLDRTLARFGAIHLLVNNAGVGVAATVWETTQADWEWIIGVNLWGVIHGVRLAVPVMLQQDTECHIVNTSSITGLVANMGPGAYASTKFAIVAISESLFYDLKKRHAKIKVSVLCPYWVESRIMDAARNRPAPPGESIPGNSLLQSPAAESGGASGEDRFPQQQQHVMSAEEAADCVFTALKKDQFYILTHAVTKDWIRTRTDHIIAERDPPPAPR